MTVPGLPPLPGEPGPEQETSDVLWVPGRARSRRPGARSWLHVGFGLGTGLLLAYALAAAIVRSAAALILVALAAFLAVSLDPLVGAMTGRRMRRGAAAAAVLVCCAALFAAFVLLAVPPIGTEITALSKAIPKWLQELHDHHSTLGRLEDRYHVVEKAKAQLQSPGLGATLASGVLGAGRLVLDALAGALIVATLTIYFLVGLPTVKAFGLRFVPAARRTRVATLTDQILSQVGRYMLGNMATSGLAGAATFVWAWGTGIPYAALLGVFVAIMDLIPVIGSTIGGIVVSLTALAVSVPVAAATAIFYTAFRFAEDHLITPFTMRYAVRLHPAATMIAVLLGAATLGIIGALLAVPAATAAKLILEEVVFPAREHAR